MQNKETLERPCCAGYKIIKTIGKGSYGVVKLVVKDDVQYAMKIFEPHVDNFLSVERGELDEDWDAFVEKMATEVNLVTNLDSKNVIKYHAFGQDIWYKEN